ncbi:hypothetical protein V494_04905 [Pseudogymnoascus sp. VKM F-4513 (FW-928)]|nr:hypothetical protein V494_04905 [Pseudogymnoascus sp. VKM F-4513 (FW-928)]
MARTRHSKVPGPAEMRTTWTRFYLPHAQDWPTWSTSYSDPHRGPLAGVEGIRDVWVGRMVEDPEQAALIILWRTDEYLKKFKDSPAFEEFLRCLPKSGPQDALESGTLLRDLSLGNGHGDSSVPTPSRFLSFRWTGAHGFNVKLEGRVTFTALTIRYTSDSIPESSLTSVYGAVHSVLDKFRPSGCEDIHSLPMQTGWWKLLATVDNKDALADNDPWQLGERVPTAENETGRMVLCEFRQWNGHSNATLEREEATANNPLTRESWNQMLATLMPPVIDWAKERWDIQLLPRAVVEEEEYEEDSEV